MSPRPALLGLAVEAEGAFDGRVLVAATRLEGQLLAELTRPSALVVDVALAGEGARELGLAAPWGAAMISLGEGSLPAGFAAQVAATLPALETCLSGQVTPSRSAPAADDALAVVRARYADSLGDKARTLADGVVRLVAGGATAAERDELRRLAHRLRGSAGSYGFPALGEVAATIDNALLGGVVELPSVTLARALELLAPWQGCAAPLASPWPLVEVEGGHRLLGEVARIAQRARVRVRVPRPGVAPLAGVIGRLVEVDVDPPEGEASAPGSLVIGPARVVGEGTGDSPSFPRAALAARLPALLAAWSGAGVA